MPNIRGYYLTEKDRLALRSLVERDRRRNTPTGGGSPPNYDDQLGGHQAPEVYIAKTPADGIPGLVDLSTEVTTGTGSPYSPDVVLTYAECRVYRISTIHNIPELQPFNFTEIVWNIHTEDIPGDTWIIISRDKHGYWLAQPFFCCGSSSNGDTGTGTGTSTSTFTSTGTGTSTTEGCDPVTIQESDVRCEDGVLNIYGRTVWLDIVNGCMSKLVGGWTFLRAEGCCECPDVGTSTDDTPGTSTTVTGTSTSTGDDDCNCATFPEYFLVYLNGFTSIGCTNFNGYFKLLRSGNSCTYVGTGGSGGSVSLTLTLSRSGGGNTWTLTLTHSSSGNTVTYQGTTTDNDCCLDKTLFYTSGTCSPHPSSVVVYPGTPCPAPTGTGGTGTFDTGTSGIVTGTGGGPFSGCCSGNMPYTMTVTFTNVLGCACLDGVSVVLTYTGADVWSRTFTACGGDSLIQVSCISANNFGFVMSGHCTIAGTADAWTCIPLFFSGNKTVSGCCGGTVGVTITA